MQQNVKVIKKIQDNHNFFILVKREKYKSFEEIINNYDFQELSRFVENKKLNKDEKEKIINLLIDENITLLYYFISNNLFSRLQINYFIELCKQNKYLNYLSDLLVVDELNCKLNKNQKDKIFKILLDNQHISEMIMDYYFNNHGFDKIHKVIFKILLENKDISSLFSYLRFYKCSENEKNKIIDLMIKVRNLNYLFSLIMTFNIDNIKFENKIVDIFLKENNSRCLFYLLKNNRINDMKRKEKAIKNMIGNKDKQFIESLSDQYKKYYLQNFC